MMGAIFEHIVNTTIGGKKGRDMAHILICDDDELIAELAADILISEGHACGWVTDGQKALDLLQWRRPDLLLLDQDMPNLTGYQVLRYIRTSENLYDLPVIMFTAIAGPQEEDRARYQGAQEYIRKPFDQKFLLWRVNQVLRAHAERPRHVALADLLYPEERKPEPQGANVRPVL